MTQKETWPRAHRRTGAFSFGAMQTRGGRRPPRGGKAPMSLIQLGGRNGIWLLRLFKHFQRGIERITQVSSGERTAPDSSNCHEFHFSPSPGEGIQCARSQFHLYRPGQNAVGRCNIEIDERDRVQVNIGGGVGSLWVSQVRISG